MPVSGDAAEIRIEGNATPEEIAAVTAIVFSLAAPAPKLPRERRLWNAPGRQVRPRITPGAGAWRASALPR